MKSGFVIKTDFLYLLILFFFAGCSADYTNYYKDGQEEGLAIFSNTGNNLMTCYVNNTPWQTHHRTISAFSFTGTNYELYIRKPVNIGGMDTLAFEWQGDYDDSGNHNGYISLYLIAPKPFGYKEFSALNGKRIIIDGNNGYFSSVIDNFNTGNIRGTGAVYFQTSILDSTAVRTYNGKISGLFEATFGGDKITRGRFDHTITPQQVSFIQ